eukprot:1480728-Amphidinium_carterae.1
MGGETQNGNAKLKSPGTNETQRSCGLAACLSHFAWEASYVFTDWSQSVSVSRLSSFKSSSVLKSSFECNCDANTRLSKMQGLDILTQNTKAARLVLLCHLQHLKICSFGGNQNADVVVLPRLVEEKDH